MAFSRINRYLQCRACDYAERCDALQLIERLRGAGMLRRNVDPDPGLIEELLNQVADTMACRSCGKRGINVLEEDPVDSLDWGHSQSPSRKCDACSALIPKERLEIFPKTTLCIACQSKHDSGDLTVGEEVEYCPRCGNILQLKQGQRGYRMVCPGCG